MFMIYEREKKLLILLNTLGGSIGSLDFQKLLFLYCQEEKNAPDYAFVPYRFGAFSFTSYADKRRMIAAGLLENDDSKWLLTEEGRTIAQQFGQHLGAPRSFCQRYENLRGNALIAKTYRQYPYYAIRSEMLDRLCLDSETLLAISEAKIARHSSPLLTIGYEGRSLEAYLNALLMAGVTLLCDVRRNPLSRKYGFAKQTLSKMSNGVGIRYEHAPELGIASEERRELNTQADYDVLFASYQENYLPTQTKTLDKILGWIQTGYRVALTCYEQESKQCHRHCVAESLERIGGKDMRVVHL